MKKGVPLLVVCCMLVATECLARQGYGEGYASGTDTLTARPSVGLVLSGGGARGAAHVGVIRLIEELQIPVDYVVGTSMGAIVGGLYAIGYTSAAMDSLMMHQDWKLLLSNDVSRRQLPYEQRMARSRYQISIPYVKGALAENSAYYRDAGIKVRRSSLQTFPKVLARPGLIDGNNLMETFAQLTSAYADSASYDTLGRSFACVAADLVTGREVILDRGRLAQSIRASMSIPGVFYPVYEGNQVLVDGGVVNNYPVDVARAMGADVIIGVEVNSSHVTVGELKSFSAIFERLIGTLGSNLHERNVGDTDILIQPPVKQFPVMGFDTVNLRQLIDMGYRTALLSKPQLDSLARLCRGATPATRTPSVPRPTPSPADALHTPTRRTEDPTNQVALGLRIDSEEGAAALLHIGARSPRLKDLTLGITTRLSLHPWLTARLAYAQPHALQANLAVSYGYADVVTPYGRRTDAFSYHFCAPDLYLSHLLSRHFDLRAGIRYDNYWVQHTTGRAPRQAYTVLYALWQNDLYDAPYTPTRGYAYRLEAAYNVRDRAAQGSDFWSLQGSVSGAIPLGSHAVMLPALQARFLLGEHIPLTYSNALGGYLPHRYLRQQLPFVGFKGCELASPHLVLPSLSVRAHLLADVYATAIVNYAYSADDLRTSGLGVWGAGLQLTYATTIGPIMLCTHWDDLHHRVGLYFSLGFELS